jgi:hypothetical protein
MMAVHVAQLSILPAFTAIGFAAVCHTSAALVLFFDIQILFI